MVVRTEIALEHRGEMDTAYCAVMMFEFRFKSRRSQPADAPPQPAQPHLDIAPLSPLYLDTGAGTAVPSPSRPHAGPGVPSNKHVYGTYSN